MGHYYFLLWTLLCCLLSLSTSDQASFYGGSYISMPLKEAKSSTDVHFKFKTHLANTLLFLVTGTIDHCIIKLDNGRLKVEINLGAGLSELYSSSHVKLNDFKWHKVFIMRKEANLSVIIDDIYTVNKHLPGKFFELNINHGLFVGSWRDNGTDIFFGKLENLRGCLAQLMYNGILVLEQARRRQSAQATIVQGVTWNCAAEFEAPIDRPISFVEERSFMALPHQVSHTLKLQTEIKTHIEDCLLFYNAGQKLDLFALEILKGKLKASLKHEDKVIEAISDDFIADGHWHAISIKITLNAIELIVGARKYLAQIPRGHFIEFSETFYVGGIELSKQGRAMSRGLRTADVSYKGCLRHLVIGDRQKGLPQVLVSEGLLAGCVWQYACASDPCKQQRCQQRGLDAFDCYDCSAPSSCVIIEHAHGLPSRTSFATELELLALKPLETHEGQSVVITAQHLHMVLDYPKYGIRDFGIKFKIFQLPTHGSIITTNENNSSFTLADIETNQIRYVHDGSETLNDHILLELDFAANELFVLPAYLQGKFRFTLPVNVIPVNDPPTFLNPPQEALLRIAQGGSKILDGKLLQIADPDTAAKHLVLNVLRSDCGHFEFVQQPGQTITSFTHQDVLNSDVLFVHRTQSPANESYVILQISDGIETSADFKLRVSAFQQQWRLENNTGIVLMHSTSLLITPFNLSFATEDEEDEDVATTPQPQFHLVNGPNFGVIQVERRRVDDLVGSWENATVFNSEDLRQHRVRYRHAIARPDYDEFQFRTNLNSSSTLYTFRMTFAKCHLFPIHKSTLTLNGTSEAVLTIRHLKYQTEPVESIASLIRYEILKAPLYGYFFSSISNAQMRSHDSFTQEDISLLNVKFRFYRKSYSPILDNVQLNIIAPGCRNVTENLTIVHFPETASQRSVKVYLEKLQVDEGSAGKITSRDLQINTDFVNDLMFNVTELPAHGILQISTNQQVYRNATNYFTLNDLQNNNLYYLHDDSETKHDSFHFMALSNEEENFEYVDTFRIVIKLKNDNGPVRRHTSLDAVAPFQVVVGSQKLLTSNDLFYSDLDIDTKSADIKYTFRDSVSNGDFYLLPNRFEKVGEFTQADIDGNRVLFKHKGAEFAKITFWVSDGEHHVSGTLEVQASAPFIRVVSKMRLTMKRHSESVAIVILKQHLDYSTNVYTNSDHDVLYETISGGSGILFFTGATKDKAVAAFTQADINNGLISYTIAPPHQHGASDSPADQIHLKIRCRQHETATNTALLPVWILPANYWTPLTLSTKSTLFVEESTSAVIGKSILEVDHMQHEIPASAINYYVAASPQHGYISILPAPQQAHEQGGQQPQHNSCCFTQSFINEKRVIYIQSVPATAAAAAPPSSSYVTKDRVRLNVSNGVVWLNDVVLEIQIIPERFYLVSNAQLHVNEGGVALITNAHLQIATEYFQTRVGSYVLAQEPTFGCVQVEKQCASAFTHKQLVAGSVQYAHGGAENSVDAFVVVGVAGTKRSLPITVHVRVAPVNVHRPTLVNNTGMAMWEGGTRIITNTMLAAADADRPIEVLRYQVLTCSWGNVSLVADPNISLKYFTQQFIDDDMIAFRHQNGSRASFTFVVSDGLHSSKEYAFQVKTKPVLMLDLIQRPLHIFPLQRKYLSASNLLSVVSDPDRPIYYEVTRVPTLGRLMMESPPRKSGSGVFTVVHGFTQSDLNNSRLFYEHTHPFADLYANDSFLFNVHSHLAKPLLNKKLKIYISVSSGGLDAYVTIPKVTVDEGGVAQIVLNLSGVVSFLESHAGLRAPIIHVSSIPGGGTPPQHGYIFLQNNNNDKLANNVTNFGRFSQEQFESGQVQYQHDHSDSLGDNLYFSLYLLPSYIILCNITVPILIRPINDQPFKLVTPAPHLTVVQGENYTITRADLCTEDADTLTSDLLYDIISGPQHGKVIRLPEMEIAVNHFSQADIDQRKLVYVHLNNINNNNITFFRSPSVITAADTFHLRVWDTKFRPEYTVFNVKVTPIQLNVSAGSALYIQQGMNVAPLSNKQFFVETNADRCKLKFEIRDAPKHGVIYVRDHISDEFELRDINNDSVMYMQRDMTTANDSFRMFVGIDQIGQEIDVHIQVQPLMQIGNCTVLITGATTNKLSLRYVLDATPLSKLTNSNPKYEITHAPQYGEIRKIIRSSGEQHRNVLDIPVSSFTHEEVQTGLIYIVIEEQRVGVEWVGVTQDRLGFILAASIFQPAAAELKIVIKSSRFDDDIYSTLSGPNDPAGHEGGLHFASPNMTRDYFLIISMVAGVVILGIAVIIVIKCRAFPSEVGGADEMIKDGGEHQCLQQQPIPLPRPPDRLLLQPAASCGSSHSEHVSAGVAAAATLPHCKVTPLAAANNLNHADNARYPYGVDEHMDHGWNSCDMSADPTILTRNNIMLRKNQYWV